MRIDVRPSTVPGAGCGLFAAQALRRGDVICLYTGEHFPSLAALNARRNGSTT